MTQKEIESLKKGDFITWKREGKGWDCFGRIKDDGTLFCDVIRGDGDSHIGKEDFFVESEPGWMMAEDISYVPNGSIVYNKARLIFNAYDYNCCRDKSRINLLGDLSSYKDYLKKEKDIFEQGFFDGYRHGRESEYSEIKKDIEVFAKGMLHIANLFYEKKNEEGFQEIDKLCERFDVKIDKIKKNVDAEKKEVVDLKERPYTYKEMKEAIIKHGGYVVRIKDDEVFLVRRFGDLVVVGDMSLSYREFGDGFNWLDDNTPCFNESE